MDNMHQDLETLHLKVPSEMKDNLRRLARIKKVTMSVLVRDFLRDAIEEEREE